jgi:hypothetical protein
MTRIKMQIEIGGTIRRGGKRAKTFNVQRSQASNFPSNATSKLLGGKGLALETHQARLPLTLLFLKLSLGLYGTSVGDSSEAGY